MQMVESVVLAKALDTNVRDASFRSDPDAIYAALNELGAAGYIGPSGSVELSSDASDRLGQFGLRNMQVGVASAKRPRSARSGRRRWARCKRRPPGRGWARRRRRSMSHPPLRARHRAPHGAPPPAISPRRARGHQGGRLGATDTAVTLTQTVLFPGGTNEAPDDEPPAAIGPANVAGAVAGSLIGALFIMLGVVWINGGGRRIVQALHGQLQQLKDSAVGMRIVTEQDPHQRRWRRPRDARLEGAARAVGHDRRGGGERACS